MIADIVVVLILVATFALGVWYEKRQEHKRLIKRTEKILNQIEDRF